MPSLDLVVGASAALSAADLYLQSLFGGLYTITFLDDSAAEEDATGDVIVISPSSDPATVGTKWKDYAGGVVVPRLLWAAHELATGDGATGTTVTFRVAGALPSFDAALVVGVSTALTAGEVYTQARLEAAGCAVTVFDDSVVDAAIDPNLFGLVVISDTVTAATVTTKWKNFPGAVLVLNGGSWNDHSLVSGTVTEDAGFTWFLNDPLPSWAPLPSGEYGFIEAGTSAHRARVGSTSLPVGAVPFMFGGTTDVVYGWTVEAGAVRSDGTPALGRRAAMSGRDTQLAAASAEYSTLLDSVIRWLLTGRSTQPPPWLGLEAGAYNLLTAATSSTVAFRTAPTPGIPAGALVVARSPNYNTDVHCWILETGVLRDDSTPAPGRRVALGATTVLLADSPSVEYGQLMKAVTGWAAGQAPPPTPVQVEPAAFGFGTNGLGQFPAVFRFSPGDVRASAKGHVTIVLNPAGFTFAGMPLRALVTVGTAEFNFDALAPSLVPRPKTSIALAAPAPFTFDAMYLPIRVGTPVAYVAGSINVRDGGRWLRIQLSERGIVVWTQETPPTLAQPGDVWIIP